MSFKHERFSEIIKELASKFVSLESNRTSLITITKVEINKAETTAKIFFSVFPDDQEDAATDFLKRNRIEFKEYVKEHGRLMRIPFFDFELDKGEKQRQKIDAIASRL